MDPSFLSNMIYGRYWGQFTGYEHVAMYALVIYDWILCFPDEVSFIKTPGFSPAKFAYLFCRYWPILTYPLGIWVDVPDHDHTFCAQVFKLPLILQVLNFTGPALIISLRAHAFTGRRLSLSVLLTACLVVVTMYQFWVAATQAALNRTGGCFPVDVGVAKHLSGYFLAPLLFDCMAVLVVAIHAIRAIPFELWSGSTLTRVFIRDGLLYFVAILALHAFNAAMSFQPDHAISGAGVPADLLLPSVLACRLVLNLRRAVSEDEATLPMTSAYRSDMTSFKAKSVSTAVSSDTAINVGWPASTSYPQSVYANRDWPTYSTTSRSPRDNQNSSVQGGRALVLEGCEHPVYIVDL